MPRRSKHSLRALALALAGLVLMPPLAEAHRQGFPLTRIEWNTDTQVWEVTHRANIHDFDVAIPALLQMETLQSGETLRAIDRRIRADVSITGDIELDYIGAERDGDFVYAYYELHADDPVVHIDSDLLLAERPAGQHAAPEECLVNVIAEGGVQSRVFRAGDGPAEFRLVAPR